ncbi:MAG TPA: hypothetical protein VD973_17960 [Symbiobacteriaceae bacterium]|jgi:outer membrane lipoprotein SlyB|nr:hypothetical protein [Symbiobacteriaceae bacterium]
MPIIAGLFLSTQELEKAVLHLLSEQIDGTQLKVTPLHLSANAAKPTGIISWMMMGGVFGDTIHRSDGKSVMDGIAAGATLGGLAGVIAGAAVLPGPVVLTVIGILGGGLIGFICDVLIHKPHQHGPVPKGTKLCAILQVNCQDDNQVKLAERVLEENQSRALGREL